MSHKKFILSPLSDILKNATSATFGLRNGIETYPTFDYILQSVFLKMTGAQEQKMKCICWELATYDYDYRYKRFTQKTLGECSNLDEKKIVFKDLIEQIKKYDEQFKIEEDIKNNILQKTIDDIGNIFLNSNLIHSSQKSYEEFNIIKAKITNKYILPDENSLFTNKSSLSNKEFDLIEIYSEHLYKHRNRVAHNTFSYQQNLPTLNTLIQENYKYNNYFLYFFILILIDNIFIDLYKKYLEAVENN